MVFATPYGVSMAIVMARPSGELTDRPVCIQLKRSTVVKELKAYIRPTFLNSTIEELEKAGAKDLTVIRVDALGALADSEFDRWHIVRKYDEKYFRVAKLEIVCEDSAVGQLVEIIREHAHTGEKGDGRIFVSTVEDAVNIRTGQRGREAL